MLIPPTGSSLPLITSLSDCADFTKTVQPYLLQLYTFATSPNALSTLQSFPLADSSAWHTLYLTTNPVITALVFSIATWPIFLVVSEVNKNYSQVDRVWSILPTVFHVHYSVWAHMNGLPTQRVDNVLAFSVLWSLRLTFNYWRRGGYQVGSEDYRWMIIKEKIGSVAFFVLNILFTSTLQVLILLAVTTPTYVLILVSRLPQSSILTPVETVLSRILILLIVVEYFADQQQWNYHQAKHTYQSTAKPPAGWTTAQLERGFNTTGLWKWSRHPNFAAEQAIWLTLYVWGAYASDTKFNWTVGGFISYSAVFQGSTPITEWISSGKYPEYKFYQQRVGRFLPSLLGKRWVESEMAPATTKRLKEEKSEKNASKKKK